VACWSDCDGRGQLIITQLEECTIMKKVNYASPSCANSILFTYYLLRYSNLWSVAAKIAVLIVAVMMIGYALDERGVGVQVQVSEEFSLYHSVQTGSGAYPASYPRATMGSFPEG
jgi:hypothetical protein